MNVNCMCCDNPYSETRTTFTAVKSTSVYVIQDVPTLECENCGSRIFRQDVTKKIQELTSGKLWGHAQMPAYVFHWDRPPKVSLLGAMDGTVNVPVEPAFGTTRPTAAPSDKAD